MNTDLKTGETQAPVHVEMDSQTVELPKQLSTSLVAVRAYLEFLALQERRVLAGFKVDGNDFSSLEIAPASTRWHRIVAETIGFDELGQRLVDAIQRELRALSDQLEESTLRVVISRKTPVMVHWRRWERMLRSKTLNPILLRDLWGEVLDQVRIDGRSLSGHLKLLHPILGQARRILGRSEDSWWDEDSIEFSGILEGQMLPWLRGFESYLLRLKALPIP